MYSCSGLYWRALLPHPAVCGFSLAAPCPRLSKAPSGRGNGSAGLCPLPTDQEGPLNAPVRRKMARRRRVSIRVMTLIGLLAIAAVVGLALLGKLGSGNRSEAVPGARLADFSVERFPQGTLALREFQGRPLVINLLASWCGPCWEELPYFQQVSERYREKDLVVIGVSVQDKSEDVGEMVGRLGITFPVGLDPTGAVAVGVFKIQTLPMTYFIARDGTVRSVWRGPIDAKSLDREVSRIL